MNKHNEGRRVHDNGVVTVPQDIDNPEERERQIKRYMARFRHPSGHRVDVIKKELDGDTNPDV